MTGIYVPVVEAGIVSVEKVSGSMLRTCWHLCRKLVEESGQSSD